MLTEADNLLHPELLKQELDAKRDEFSRLAEDRARDLDIYSGQFSRLVESPPEAFRDLSRSQSCGAFPSTEMFDRRSLTIAFGESWSNHEEARNWAAGILDGRTTFAADGSQLFAEREVSLPIGAVQIGWFENPHRDDAAYEKNARFILLSPSELLSADEPAIPETRVSERRFREEIETALGFFERHRGWESRGERMPVAFYDGTLFLSIALERTQIQTNMIDRLADLIKASERTRVPVVGYVDRSYARDLMTLADEHRGHSGPAIRTVDDVSAVARAEITNWGDRTPFFFGRRRGLESYFEESTGESIAGFVYLRTTADGPPARLDVPSWVFRSGLLDQLVDVVRAECVVGLGYPYPLETADQTAVITVRDRDVFLHALQGFAGANELDFRISRKAASKGRRR